MDISALTCAMPVEGIALESDVSQIDEIEEDYRLALTRFETSVIQPYDIHSSLAEFEERHSVSREMSEKQSQLAEQLHKLRERFDKGVNTRNKRGSIGIQDCYDYFELE